MKLKIRDMDIATGGPSIILLNREDARKLDLHLEDRVSARFGGRNCMAIIDIAVSSKLIKPGKVGVFEEVLAKLRAKDKDEMEISIEKKPESVGYIKKKLEGKRLSYQEIMEIVDDIAKDNLSDIELTYFVAACYLNELSTKETLYLTEAIVNTGEIFKVNKYPIVDKHCTGGVAGNRTSMIVVPIIAAAGLTIPKTSSRAITSAAGTADTVEVLAKVSFSMEEMKRIVLKTGGCFVWGGSMNLAPADDKIIHVEHPMSLDPVGQLLASILAKKKSVSSTHILIDIPVGPGTKIKTMDKAKLLKEKFEDISKHIGMKIKVVITDGSEPIGNGIGPALEARDVIWTLRNDPRGSKQLEEKSIEIAGVMLEMAGKCRKGKGKEVALEIFESGKAYDKFVEIIEAQKGKVINPEKIRVGRLRQDFVSRKDGKVIHIDNNGIAKIARIAGAPKDKEAGVYLYKHKGESVKRGGLLFSVYSDSREKLQNAIDACKSEVVKDIVVK